MICPWSRRARRVGIKIYDDVFAEPSQQPHLRLRKCRAGTRSHVVKARGVHGNAIHLAFNNNHVAQLADRLFGAVQVVQHAALVSDRVSGEFRYFGPDFSSFASVCPCNAMIFPFSLAIGNMIRSRNLEYIAAVAAPLEPGSPERAAFARSGVRTIRAFFPGKEAQKPASSLR